MSTVGYATLEVIPSMRGFQAAIERQSATAMAAAGRTGGNRFGSSAGTAAAAGFASSFRGGMPGMDKLLGVAAIGAIGKQVVGVQAQFEQSINTLGASADLTSAQMSRMSEYAKEMGKSTVFSATEASDAMVELAKAGIGPAAIEAGALEATMSVAATEGLALADSATIVSNAMTTFRLEAGKATEVADALAGGSKASTASVASLAEAMQQVGGSAFDAGLSLQETVGVLAAFDQEGIKGSDAGTSLKTMLSRLVPQTNKARKEMEALGLAFTDANGQFLPMSEIAGQLQAKLSGLSDAERTTALNTIFGSDARRAAIALMHQGEQGIDRFTAATSELGSAQKLADARMSGTAGAIEKMSGAIETAALAIGEALAPAVVKGADGVAVLADGAGSLATGFGKLAPPIQTAATALAAFAIAGRFGRGPQDAVNGLRNSYQRLRDEAALQKALAGGISGGYQRLGDEAAVASGKLTKMQTSLALGGRAMSAAKVGASNLLGVLGGPWGLGLAGATALVTHFWTEHQKAKQFVDDLTASLDSQTGALTDQSSKVIESQLASKGWLDYADKLGISLDTVRRAAEGDATALAEVEGIVNANKGNALNPFNANNWTNDSGQFMDALRNTSTALDDAGRKQDQTNRFMDEGARAARSSGDATAFATGKLTSYSGRLSEARSAIEKLLAAEEERASNAVQARRDQIALKESFIEANAAVREGKRTLDINTKAGRENMTALLDLGEQWNNTKDKVQNARGAYEGMRQKFIEVARKMGATKEEARKLAGELLEVPKNAKVRFQSEGYRERMAEIAALKDAMGTLGSADLDYTPRGFGSPNGKNAFATGGMIGGTGSGTSDSNLIWASRGEFMQRKAAVDYYGADFMRRLNALQIPKFASGGLIDNGPRRASSGGGLHVQSMTVVAQDWRDFARQGQRLEQRAGIGGFGR